MQVTLLESRPQLGGRATSYIDKASGETIDNCQHVSMGCCTNLRDLCERLQVADAFQTESELYFIAPNGECCSFSADPLPAPFHLTRAFLKLSYLSLREKVLFASAVRALAQARPEKLLGSNFADWLRTHRQTDRLIQNVWEVVLVSALSESLDRIDAAYARKVFVDGFLSHADSWKVEIPRIDLDELYSQRTRAALAAKGVDVRVQTRATGLTYEDERVAQVSLHNGDPLIADDVILAVPQHQLSALLPSSPKLDSLRQQVSQLETAPITSVHLWYDRPLTALPHAVLVGRLSQWMFNRGQRTLNGESAHYYQVVISASRQLREWSQEDAIAAVAAELRAVWPSHRVPKLLHSRMITERRAVFSVTPGIDALRPVQQTGIENLQIAGDYTQTGWPATMEGAVISGYLAAENVPRRLGRPLQIVRPGLPFAGLSRWCLGLK